MTYVPNFELVENAVRAVSPSDTRETKIEVVVCRMLERQYPEHLEAYLSYISEKPKCVK